MTVRCPLSRDYSIYEIFTQNALEIGAITVSWASLAATFAYLFNRNVKTAFIRGTAIPLTYYSLAIIDHRTFDDPHTPKHRIIRSLMTFCIFAYITYPRKSVS